MQEILHTARTGTRTGTQCYWFLLIYILHGNLTVSKLKIKRNIIT